MYLELGAPRVEDEFVCRNAIRVAPHDEGDVAQVAVEEEVLHALLELLAKRACIEEHLQLGDPVTLLATWRFGTRGEQNWHK